MRRYIKNQILQIISSMEKSEHILLKIYEKNYFANRDKLLEEMQQTAIDIGNEIEKSEGKGTEAVTSLEEYCELLWECSQTYTENDSNKIIKQITKKRIQFTNLIQYTIKEKIEVVFLPYKASMWDSLESVWMAANEDLDVETYVIPIPYYDMNTDHSFGSMHYEGDEYPNYVPITPWNEYNIEVRKPDIIFIHNPYDGSNFVTSVHPYYYSSNLKKNTQKLVYIPYFITMDNNIAEHFCVVPAAIHADQVIVQSEKIKNFYIYYLRNWIMVNNYEKALEGWEKKFLALGSPKIDKVLHTKREDCAIPEAWESLIVSKNGTLKKVIFYNTTVSELLNGNEKFLNKIKRVLSYFKTRKDFVLLWRPHPLNAATCSSMRPQLLEEYLEIINLYRIEGWGIYDDTADFNRAIAISDAYYGARSSVVELFIAAGKSVMIENIEV